MKYISKVINCQIKRGYKVFDKQDHNYNLNLVGVRRSQKPNTFDDLFIVYWFYNKECFYHIYNCTTDPGFYWLQNPMNVRGTAVLCPGQYLGLWRLGLFKGRYRALIQNAPCMVWRDSNKNKVLDHDPSIIYSGWYGICCHTTENENVVDKASAGCQVIPKGFNELILLCEKSMEIYGNRFTYTLLEDDWLC